ncbi:MAG: phage portal protein [Firmicutes bacterium]|nr:phage portal protein [Bacillota bacterium]
MIIDEEIVKDGMTDVILAKLIARHSLEQARFERLYNYYMGNHAICSRRRSSESVANNKIVCNHAKYIVDIAKSYLVGNPVSYTCSDGYDIEAVKNSFCVQDMPSIDAELEKLMSIYGRAYELVYADEESLPRSAALPTENTFIVYGAGVGEIPLYGIHYYKKRDIDGCVTGVCCIVCDDSTIYTYENDADSFLHMRLADKRPHYFGKLPMVEYRNNEERQGDFEQLIPLIDAYNILESDRVNDKEQFVDAFLFLTGIDLDSEQAKKLREERILMGYDGAEAQYLAKVMSESDVEVLKDSLKTDIHHFSMIPDLSDQTFGTNLSGVAIKYKLMGFEQHVRNKERYFTKSLKKRFELYTNFLSLKGAMEYVPIHRIDVVFTRNLPVNELEVSQMVRNLAGIATSETLLSQLSFVGDAKEEAQLAAKERMLDEKMRVNEE